MRICATSPTSASHQAKNQGAIYQIENLDEVEQKAKHACVYNTEYRFNKCGISCCKNYNEVTPTKCLALDRVRPDGTKVISDDEIRLYKFNGIKISTRTVSTIRKKQVSRVFNMLALAEYIRYISNNKTQNSDVKISRRGEVLFKKMEERYPLKHKELEFESWMWPHLLSADCWKGFNKFRGIQASEGSEDMIGSKEVTLVTMLCVSEETVAKLRACFK